MSVSKMIQELRSNPNAALVAMCTPFIASVGGVLMYLNNNASAFASSNNMTTTVAKTAQAATAALATYASGVLMYLKNNASAFASAFASSNHNMTTTVAQTVAKTAQAATAETAAILVKYQIELAANPELLKAFKLITCMIAVSNVITSIAKPKQSSDNSSGFPYKTAAAAGLIYWQRQPLLAGWKLCSSIYHLS